ncbi:MAG: hypothetical protein H0V89_11940 [Deltaproteobacteria bacterium]|nr:hypothetical protein [Deltaproteobacteria bacterium]
MERVKVALHVVIALALSAQVFQSAVPEARAQSPGPITCKAWYQEMIGALKGPEKALVTADAYAAEVNAWMTQNPGDPIFRTTLVQGGGAYVDILCVR